MLMDNHGSHITPEFVALANQNRIRPYPLIAYLTHCMQLLDVGRRRILRKAACSMYEDKFRDYYAQQYENRQDHQYRPREKPIEQTCKTLNRVLLATRLFHSRNAKKSQTPMNEVAEYLNEQPYLPEMDKILEEWRKIASLYPTLAQMAKDVLGIPVSDVGVGRLFSLARAVVDYRRNRLQRKTIENIIRNSSFMRPFWRILRTMTW